MVATTDERDAGPSAPAPVTRADGDDIVVVPAGTADSRPRNRPLLVAAATLTVVAVAAVVALAARSGSSPARLQVASPAARPAAKVAPAPAVSHAPRAAASTVPASASATPTVATPTRPPARAAHAGVPAPATTPATAAAPPPAAPATSPPATAAAPQSFPASVLTWDAPRALTIAAGKTARLTVTAHNPTGGTVTLPHPLSCAPRLDQSEMCAEVVQTIAPLQSANATYTIDATGFAPGHYTLRIEGLLTIAVTVS